MSNPKPHQAQNFASVPLVLTFVNEPAATGYECQNRDANRLSVISHLAKLLANKKSAGGLLRRIVVFFACA
jgi:hypothetical protein